MDTRKLTIVLGALLSTGVLMAQAPDTAPAPADNPAQTAPSHRAPNPEKQAKHLAKKLGLSGDQEAQLKPIIVDRQQQVQSLRADTSLNAQDRRARMQAIQQDSKTKIEAILNDTQKQKFEQMIAERRAHHKGHNQDQQGL